MGLDAICDTVLDDDVEGERRGAVVPVGRRPHGAAALTLTPLQGPLDRIPRQKKTNLPRLHIPIVLYAPRLIPVSRIGPARNERRELRGAGRERKPEYLLWRTYLVLLLCGK